MCRQQRAQLQAEEMHTVPILPRAPHLFFEAFKSRLGLESLT